ncbi:MAG: glycosyltransferase family 4 protein [Gaiellaceae bacterium]
MRVVWFSHSSGLGGSEIGLLEAAEGLRQRAIHIHVVLPAEGPLLARLEKSRIPFTIVPYPWWTHDPDSPSNARRLHLTAHLRPTLWLRLARVMRTIKPQLVVTNTSTIVVGAVTARLFRLPHIWYVREFGQADYDLRFDIGERRARRLMARLSHTILVNSNALRRAVAKPGTEKKVRVMPYAIAPDPDAWPTPTPLSADGTDGLTLLLLGSLRPSKGQEEAIRAVARLAERKIGVRLRLAGEGPAEYRRELEALAAELGVSERVDAGGFEGAPGHAIAAADVVLVCSRCEAFGRTTVEAMRVGRPVIGADSGATAELVSDGRTGLLYRSGDPDDLAAKIEMLSSDRALLARLGQAAIQSDPDFAMYLSDLSAVFRGAGSRTSP